MQDWEGSHSGLVRAPAKRLPWETGVVGSNPTPSAIMSNMLLIKGVIFLIPPRAREYGSILYLDYRLPDE